MQKHSLLAATFCAAFAFGFMACAPELPGVLDPLGVTQKDSSSSANGGGGTSAASSSIAAPSMVSGSLSEAPTYASGVATVKTSAGTYTFTETTGSANIAARAVNTEKSGTWKFLANGGFTYEGTYQGDISIIISSSSAAPTELKLTITKLSGKVVKTKEFDFKLSGATAATVVEATIPFVSSEEEAPAAEAEYTLNHGGENHKYSTKADGTYEMKNEKGETKETGKYKKAGSFLFLTPDGAASAETAYKIKSDNVIELYTTPAPTTPASGDNPSTGGDAGKDASYTVIYNGQNVATLTSAQFDSLRPNFTEGTDYTLDATTKTITLTESGYTKYQQSNGHVHDGEGHGGQGHSGEDEFTLIYIMGGTPGEPETIPLSSLELVTMNLNLFKDAACTQPITDKSTIKAGDTVYAAPDKN